MGVFWGLKRHSHGMDILSIIGEIFRSEALVEATQDYGLYETYDHQVLAINTMHLKTLNAMKVLPNTTKL